MDFTEIIKAMRTMTDAQIESIQKTAVIMMKERENVRKAEAIQNFKKAFFVLREVGVYVSVECEDEDNYMEAYINGVDQFNFS